MQTPQSSRHISQQMQQASQSSVVIGPIILVDLHFLSGHIRLTDASSDIAFDSNGDNQKEIFTAVGDLLEVSSFEEGAEIRPYSVQLQLSGIPSHLISLALQEHYQGRSGKIFIVFFDDDHQLVQDPLLLFQGRMDNMSLSVGEDASISLTLKNLLADWEYPRIKRYTSESHAATDGSDRFFSFVTRTAHQEIEWGSA